MTSAPFGPSLTDLWAVIRASSGAETFVYGQLPAGKEIVVRISETAPDIGSRIVVGLPRERLHLFDLEHGRRL